jgi:hypothetical protein
MGVADIVEVRHLTLVEQDGVFQLARIADHTAFAHEYVFAKIGVVADLAVATNHGRAFDHHAVFDNRALADENFLADERHPFALVVQPTRLRREELLLASP